MPPRFRLRRKCTSCWFAVLCGLLFTCTLSAQEQHAAAARIVGSYQGLVFNGDNLDPVRTTFALAAGGRLTGNYSVDDESGTFAGTLSGFIFEDSHTLSLEWTDMYGEGHVTLTFSQDYSRFDGFWGSYDSDSMNPWYGERE